MYSIILKDGKIINIKGDDVVFYEKTKIVRFYNSVRIVAEINMDNVVGWVRTNCIKNEE
jgi:hypothetical protein